MSKDRTPGEQRDLDKLTKELDEAKAASIARSEQVDDLKTRFQDLRIKNNFRLMLEEVFSD